MASKFIVLKPVSISRGILPVDRELQPGDFGLSEAHLEEMVKKGQASKPKSKSISKKEDPDT